MTSILEKISALSLDVEGLVPEEVDWIWEVKEVRSFHEWFMSYIGKSNFVYNRQLREYEALADTSDLHDDRLDEALQACGINISDYLSSELTTFDLDQVDVELKELRAQNDLAADVEALLSEENQNALSLEQAVERRLKAGQADCQKEGQSLMKINAPLKSAISNFFCNFYKLTTVFQDSEDPDIQNNCISKMSLESLLNTCEKFYEYANICLKHKFEQPSFIEKHAVSMLMSFLEEASSLRSISSSSSSVTADLPKKMWKANLTKIDLQGSLSGLTSAIQYIQMLRKNPLIEKANILTMKLEEGNLQREICKLSQNLDFLIKHEASDIAEDIVLSSIFGVVESISRARIQRRQMVLTELCSVINVTSEFLHHTDLVWMLLMHDSQRFKFATELLKEASDTCIEELEKHDATMGGLKMINEQSLGEDALTNGQHHLLHAVQRLLDRSSSENDCVDRASSENELVELEKDLFCNVLESLEKSHSGRENAVTELLMELTKGPTSKPYLVDTGLSLSMCETSKKLEYCQLKVDKLSSEFSAKQMMFKKSPVVKNRRLLWAWFLVAPEKLQEAVKLASKEL